MHKLAPLKLFALDRECKEKLDKEYEGDPFYLPSELILPSSIQGFVLCRMEDKSPVMVFYAFPYTRKRRWRRERILRITRPLPFSRIEGLKEDALSAFMREASELGRRMAARQIEIELYKKIRSRIFFPSTNCAVNTYNSPDSADLFEKAGVSCTQKTFCFEVDLDRFQTERDEEIRVRPYLRDGDRNLYYELWISSGECPYDLAHSGFWYVNAFGWPRLGYEETSCVLNQNEFILFAEKDGEPMGLIHWWPDLFPMLREGGRKAIFLPEASAREALNRIREGKIFKILVSKRAGKYRDRVERSLVSGAMSTMKEKFRFRTCQVGNMPPEKQNLIEYIHLLGGKEVHEIRYMRKKP